MNIRLLSSLFLLLLLIACKKESALSFSEENITEGDLEICSNKPCPEVTVNYDLAEGDDAIAKKINSMVTRFICASLYLGEGEPPSRQTVAEAMTGFIQRYEEDKREFPDMASEYAAQISATRSYVSENIVSFQLKQYSYTGGAHGYQSVFYTNIDRKTGEEISMEDLFKDIDDFTLFAEDRMREQYGIPIEEGINSTGFWFENEIFHLPDSIGFDKDHLVLWYNPYDIASYAEGAIEIRIPMKEAAPYLAIQ